MAIEITGEVNSTANDTEGLRQKAIAFREVVKQFPGYIEHFWDPAASFTNPQQKMLEFSIGTSQHIILWASNYYGSWSCPITITDATGASVTSLYVGSHIGRLVYNDTSAIFYLEKDGVPDNLRFGRTLDDNGDPWVFFADDQFYKTGSNIRYSGNTFGGSNLRTPDGKLMVIPSPPMVQHGSTIVHTTPRLANLMWCGTLTNSLFRYDGNLFRLSANTLLRIE